MKTTKITTTNTLNTNTTNNSTNSKGLNNMKKTKRFKTRLIAGILSAITVFSVGTMAICDPGNCRNRTQHHLRLR